MTSLAKTKVSDIASTNLYTLSEESTLEQAIKLFAEHGVSSLIIIKSTKPVGIVTERDLLHLVCSGYDKDKVVREIMSTPIVSARDDIKLSIAQSILRQNRVRHLVLVDATGKLSGIVSETDFHHHMEKDLFKSIQQLSMVMSQSLEIINTEQSLANAFEFMSSLNLDHILIGDDNHAIGIITERDIPKLMAQYPDPTLTNVTDAMTSPLKTIALDTPVEQAAKLMQESRLRHLCVVDKNNRVVGTLSQHQILERLSNILVGEKNKHLLTQLDVILDSTGVGIWELEHQSQTITINETCKQLLNCMSSPNNGHLSQFIAYFDSQEQERIETLYKQILQNKLNHFSDQFRLSDDHGNINWLLVKGKIIEQEQPEKGYRTVGTIQDITTQIHVEQRLDENEERYKGYFYHSNNPIFIIDPAKDQILDANPSACELLKYSLNELLETPMSSIHPHEMKILIQFTEEIYNKGKATTDQLSCYTKDGEHIPAIILGVEIPYKGIRAVLATVQDITKQKKDEETIRKSANLFQTIFEQAAVGVALIDSTNGQFIRINQRYCDIIGYSIQEANAGMSLQQITHTSDLQQDLDNMSCLLAGDIREYSMQKCYHKKNGSIIWVNQHISPTWQQGEQPTTHIAVVEDITARKQALEALQREQSFSSKLIDTAQIIILVLDTDSNIVMFNAYMEQLSGYQLSEVKGKNWFDIFIPKAQDSSICSVFDETLSFNCTKDNVNPIITKSGEQKIIEWYNSKLANDKGKTVSVVAVGTDITQRILMESELKKHKENLEELVKKRTVEVQEALTFNHLLLEKSPVGILVYDSTGQCVLANEFVCKITGGTHKQLTSQNYHEIQSWKKSGLYGAALVTLKENKPQSIDVHLATTFNKEIFIECQLVPLEESMGELMLILHDISERKHYEEELINAEMDAQQANRAKSSFLANMSHEIRTPMNGIIGMTHLAMQTKLNEKQKNFISKAHYSAQNLLSILNDILDFSKIEAGKLEFELIDD